jgi:hypothetical protein
MKGGHVCLSFQPICVIMIDSNQLNNFFDVLLKDKPKRNAWLLKHSRMAYFHLECQNPIKNIK